MSAEEVIRKYIPPEVLNGMDIYFANVFMLMDDKMVSKYLKKSMEEYASIRERKAAEAGWDAATKYGFEREINEATGKPISAPDKNTYINKNYPL